jgi:predicted nucleic acid-binding protein
MARRTTPLAAHRLILDAGAVIALARGDQRARAYLQRALELDAEVRVPVVVVAETTRGGPKDATVNRVLAAIGEPTPPTAPTARLAGRLLARARRSDTIDALVAAEAIEAGGGYILTGDPDDLRALTGGEPSVQVQSL